MPYKIKEHYRKTKKGLVKVKESKRKDRLKKALLIGAGALTTIGLGALAYKNLGKNIAKKATTAVKNSIVKVSNKADDIAANKARNITNLLSGNNIAKNKTYKTLPDPWLEKSRTYVKPDKTLTVIKKEQKLLTGSKYVSPKYESATIPKNVTGKGKNLKQEISSQRTLIKREATDIKNANKQLELANKYKASDSPALVRTGKNYETRANTQLIKINERQVKTTKKDLITLKGKNKNSVRQGDTSRLVIKKKPNTEIVKVDKLDDTIKSTNKVQDLIKEAKKPRGRRQFLENITGVKTVRQLQTKNPMQVIMEVGKDSTAIEKAGQETADKISNVLSKVVNRRSAIQSGAKGAEGAVKNRIKRKLKGKLIGRLTKALKTGELSPKNQSSIINKYNKVANQLKDSKIPNKTRRQLLQAAEDLVIPGGDAAKKKKALELYQRTLKELDAMKTDTAVGLTRDYVKSKTKNKTLGKMAKLTAKLKKLLTGEV